MKYIFNNFKNKKRELLKRSIEKSRNINVYKNMSKKRLINLITPGPKFKIEEYTAKLLKIDLKDFIYNRAYYL